MGYPADRGHSWSKNSGSVSSSCKRKGQHLEGEKKKSRHQLVEMVPEFIITERKAGFFFFVLIVFIGSCLWMIPVEAGLEIGTRAGVSVSVCVCVHVYLCMQECTWY